MGVYPPVPVLNLVAPCGFVVNATNVVPTTGFELRFAVWAQKSEILRGVVLCVSADMVKDEG